MLFSSVRYVVPFCLLIACSGGEPSQTGSGEGGSSGSGVVAGASGAGASAGSGAPSGGAGGSSPTGGNSGSGAGAGAETGGSAGAGAGAGGGGASAGAGAGGAGAGGAGTGGTGGTGGTAGGTPQEEALPDLTTVRQEHAVAAVAGEVYVIGGYTPNATATVHAYNPTTRMWRSVRDFPTVLNHANAAAVGNTLYVTGFYSMSSMSMASRQVFAYDPAANEWTERMSMPENTQRATGCVAVLGSKIYLFGGARNMMTVTDASAYDTVGDSWETLPALPESREHCAAGAIDGILYIAAGRAGGISGFRSSTLAYDPSTRMYSQKTPITTPRGGVASAVLRGRLFVFGGEGNPASGTDGVFPNIEAFDPVSNAWEALPPLDIPRHGYGAAELDGRIYLAGGATMQGLGAVADHSMFFFE